MKKILTATVYNLIASAIVLGIFYLIFLPLWVAVFLYVVFVLTYFVMNVLMEYVTMINIKRAFFWLKYKRVKEVVKGQCNGCILYDTVKTEDCISSGRTRTCLNTKTILAKRNYNIFKWLKKIFILFVIAILSVSCVTINVYENKPTNYKKEAEKLEQKENIWY